MPKTEIIIIGDGEAKTCCGEEQKLVDQIRHLKQGIILAYGDKISVEFLDLKKDQTNPLVEKAIKEGKSFPLLLLDGELKFEGGIPLLALKVLLDHLEEGPI